MAAPSLPSICHLNHGLTRNLLTEKDYEPSPNFDNIFYNSVYCIDVPSLPPICHLNAAVLTRNPLREKQEISPKFWQNFLKMWFTVWLGCSLAAFHLSPHRTPFKVLMELLWWLWVKRLPTMGHYNYTGIIIHPAPVPSPPCDDRLLRHPHIIVGGRRETYMLPNPGSTRWFPGLHQMNMEVIE